MMEAIAKTSDMQSASSNSRTADDLVEANELVDELGGVDQASQGLKYLNELGKGRCPPGMGFAATSYGMNEICQRGLAGLLGARPIGPYGRHLIQPHEAVGVGHGQLGFIGE